MTRNKIKKSTCIALRKVNTFISTCSIKMCSKQNSVIVLHFLCSFAASICFESGKHQSGNVVWQNIWTFRIRCRSRSPTRIWGRKHWSRGPRRSYLRQFTSAGDDIDSARTSPMLLLMPKLLFIFIMHNKKKTKENVEDVFRLLRILGGIFVSFICPVNVFFLTENSKYLNILPNAI